MERHGKVRSGGIRQVRRGLVPQVRLGEAGGARQGTEWWGEV